MKEILDRLEIGRTRYGHGVRVDDDTRMWGTKKNSWMEMAREEFLDAVIYVIADYIRCHRGPHLGDMGKMEVDYIMWKRGGEEIDEPKKWAEGHREIDDNGLIIHILDTWEELEPCRHKSLIRTLLNILDE